MKHIDPLALASFDASSGGTSFATPLSTVMTYVMEQVRAKEGIHIVELELATSRTTALRNQLAEHPMY